MNNARRKKLTKLMEELSGCRTLLEELKDEEQECFDNMPEGLQESEKAQAMEQAADNLEEAVNYIEEAEGYIQEAIDQ